MSATLADAEDPTYTHFAHKDAFFGLLSDFLALDVSRAPARGEDENEEALVKDLGAIVSLSVESHIPSCADGRSWITTCPCRDCWTPISTRSFLR